MKKIISDIIASIYPVSSKAVEDIISNSKKEFIPAKKNFIEKGKRNQKEYFIIDGVCRSMLYSPKGEDITLSFYQENSILPPNITRTNTGISNQYFQAITDLTLISVSQKKFLEIILKYQNLSIFANKSIENELASKIEKEEFLLSFTAKEKLMKFRKKYKNLENRIPHNIIASYFGITKVSFSRIRKETASNFARLEYCNF